jgi:hypothetical protein
LQDRRCKCGRRVAKAADHADQGAEERHKGGDRDEEAEVGTGVEAGDEAAEKWDIAVVVVVVVVVVVAAAGDVAAVMGGDSRRSG